MRSRPVRITPAAVVDIDAIGIYTADAFGERQAERYAETIDLAIAELAADPTSLHARHRADVHPDARTIHIGRRGRRASHFILFRIDRAGAIEVARVLHESMDLRRHLPVHFGTDGGT